MKVEVESFFLVRSKKFRIKRLDPRRMKFGGNYEKEEKKRTRGYYFRSEKGGRRGGGGGLLYLEQSHPPSRLANGCLARELFSLGKSVEKLAALSLFPRRSN